MYTLSLDTGDLLNSELAKFVGERLAEEFRKNCSKRKKFCWTTSSLKYQSTSALSLVRGREILARGLDPGWDMTHISCQ